MARNENKRQKKLAKRNKRSTDVKKQRNRSANISNRDLLVAAERAPWVGCFMCGRGGMHNIVAVRQFRSGSVACLFLADSYCLGVKVAYLVKSFDMESFRERKAPVDWETISPAKALKFISASIEYARGNGFEPHRDALTCSLIFQGVDANECVEEFVFGFEGKPMYTNGPHDSRERQVMILNTLAKLGEGNYHFMLGGPGGPDLSVFDDLSDEDFDEEDFDDADDFSDALEDDSTWARQDQRQVHLAAPNKQSEETTQNIDAGFVRSKK